MSSFNKAILMGNLTRDPEVRFTQSNQAVVKFSLALNRRYKKQDGTWTEATDFIDVTMFGKRGEAFGKYHKKGDSAFVEGELRQDTWEDKNTGQKRQKLYVVANAWEFVKGEKGSSSSSGGASASDTNPFDPYGDFPE